MLLAVYLKKLSRDKQAHSKLSAAFFSVPKGGGG